MAVVGASGLIGGHLARALLDRGDDVVALVRGERSGIAYRAEKIELLAGVRKAS